MCSPRATSAADRDIDSIVRLFAEDATVIDEGEERHGTAEIRAWQTGAASKYTYTTEITGTEALGPDRYLVTAHTEADLAALGREVQALIAIRIRPPSRENIEAFRTAPSSVAAARQQPHQQAARPRRTPAP